MRAPIMDLGMSVPQRFPPSHEKVTKSSVRGDLDDPVVKFARDSALDGAVKWFNQYLPAS
jgi:hypothetical protein